MQREAAPDPTLHLWLLGPWRAQLDGGPPLRLATRHARLLLARLALAHPRPLAKASLIRDLFPDCPAESAARRLRATRHYLRAAIGELLLVDDQGLGLAPGLRVTCDYLEFLRRTGPGATRADLEAAVELYRGALLQSAAEGWAAAEAHAAHARYVAALRSLIAFVRAVNSPAASCAAARRWAAEEPWSEQAHVAYLEALIAAGRRGAALAQLAAARALLRAEWADHPGGALEELARAIGRLPADALAPPPPAEPAPPAQAIAEAEALLAAPHRIGLAGRTAERAALQELWRAALAGRPRGLLLVGPAGAGKTRLAEELAREVWLRARHTVLWCGAGDGPGDWLATLGRALARLLAEGRPALARACAELDPLSQGVLVHHLPELRALLPEAPEPPPLSPAAAAARRVEAACRLLDLLAGRGGLLLVVDGLERADAELRATLDWLLDGRRRAAVLVTAQPGPAEALAAPAGLLGRLDLGPLDAAQTAALLTGALGAPVAPAALGRLAELQATPGLLLGLLRGLLHGGALRYAPGSGWEITPADLPLPAAGAELLEMRLARLSPPARELAELLAVLGRPADEALLCALDAGEGRRLAAQAELLAAGLLAERGEDLRFTAPWLPARLRQGLPAGRLAALHARAAAALAARTDVPRLEQAAHHAGAGGWPAALDLALAAAEQARAEGRRPAFEQALGLADRALAALDLPPLAEPRWLAARLRERLCAGRRDSRAWAEALARLSALADASGRPEWRCEALQRYGLARLAAGAPAEAGERLATAAALAQEHRLAGLEVWCRLGLADALDAGERYAAALRECERAAEAAHLADAPEQRLRALIRLGYAYARDGQIDSAVQLLDGLRQHPLLARRPLLAARLAHHLGLALIAAGASSRGLAALRDCLQQADAVGDVYWRLRGQGALCAALVGFGLHADGLALGETLIPLARHVDDWPAYLGLTASLAAAHYGRGLPDQALGLALAGAEEAARQGHRALAAAHCCLGLRAALAAGRRDEARALFARAEPLLGPAAPADQLAAAAQAALALGLPARARDYAALSVGRAARPALDLVPACAALWDAGEVLAALDGPAAAAPVVERAVAALLDHLGRLDAPELRRAFVAADSSRAALAAVAAAATPRRLAWLPIRQAPTGRPLHADELLPVVWSLHDPGDPSEPQARRQAQIRRLAAEALGQGAVATVDALAAALDVTGRTVKRDLSALRVRGEPVVTRGGLLGTGHRPALVAARIGGDVPLVLGGNSSLRH